MFFYSTDALGLKACEIGRKSDHSRDSKIPAVRDRQEKKVKLSWIGIGEAYQFTAAALIDLGLRP